MGSFFTNVHVRVPDGVEPAALADRLRHVVEKRLVAEGMDARHAGQIYVNIDGTARDAGETTLAIEVIPLAHPRASHVERVVVEVTAPGKRSRMPPVSRST